ncbi:hypothetical protein AGMMS49944_00710 [Spirochaetia bacterium]|nr:hypothetical protein AGMMS49944_00710 [Spirochaetia bacterium]
MFFVNKKTVFPILLMMLGMSVVWGGGNKEDPSRNSSLDKAVQASAKTIETKLPQGAKTAILSFAASSQEFSDYIIDELAISLAANNKISIIERQYTDDIRKELNIQRSGEVSDDDVKRVGIQLGAQYIITGSLVDIGDAYRFRVIAINVETAVREASASLSINITDPQVVFLLTGERQPVPNTAGVQTAQNGNSGKVYKIGDRGPGGGFIFFAEGRMYMECSLNLGSFTWREAKTVASNYKGGGFTDWHLPEKAELDMIYHNLKKKGLGGLFEEEYWSSSEYSIYSAWHQGFSFGGQKWDSKGDKHYIRAVRVF